jgi:hypothetical protein
MAYRIVLSPSLELSAAEFATAWNETPECAAVGRAQETRQAGAQFDPAMQAIVEVIGMVAVGVASNALYDLIKEALFRKGVTKRIEIMEVAQPEGTRLVVVKIEEG